MAKGAPELILLRLFHERPTAGVSWSGHWNMADRIIAATSRAHAFALVTADERIRSTPLVKCIW